MDDKLQEALVRDFPGLFVELDMGESLTAKTPLGQRGIECDDGWAPILRNLCNRVDASSKLGNLQVRFVQIKEKFGVLRVYWDSAVKVPKSDFQIEQLEAVTKAVSVAVLESSKTCEHCSKPGEACETDGGWLQTLCPACQEHFHCAPVPPEEED